MRYAEGHKLATRQKIVAAAAAEFRRHGTDAVGVIPLMKRAGLTHGGFYTHFKSKEELIREAVLFSAEENNLAGFLPEPRALEKIIRHYLRPGHRDRPEAGCPVAALLHEAPRRAKATRSCLVDRMTKLVGLLEKVLPPALTGKARTERATALTALLLGSLQMARATTDQTASNRILETGISTALVLART